MEKWEHLDEQKQVYGAVITAGDNAVGTILDALKAEGLEENTIVMFSLGFTFGPEPSGSPPARIHVCSSSPLVMRFVGIRNGALTLVIAGVRPAKTASA